MFSDNPNSLKGHEGQLVKTKHASAELACYDIEKIDAKNQKEKKDIVIIVSVESIPSGKIGMYISSEKSVYINEEESIVTLLVGNKIYKTIIKDSWWMTYVTPYPYGTFLQQDKKEDE